jgi:hypothetical protein
MRHIAERVRRAFKATNLVASSGGWPSPASDINARFAIQAAQRIFWTAGISVFSSIYRGSALIADEAASGLALSKPSHDRRTMGDFH